MKLHRLTPLVLVLAALVPSAAHAEEAQPVRPIGVVEITPHGEPRPAGTTYDITHSAVGALEFGAQTFGTTSSARTVQIVNKTAAPQKLPFWKLIKGDDAGAFKLTDDRCLGVTLAPNASCSIRVAFRPVRTGEAAARLEFSKLTSGHDTYRITVLLSGEGVFQSSPTYIDFGTHVAGTVSAPRDVAYRNSTGSPVRVAPVAISTRGSLPVIGGRPRPDVAHGMRITADGCSNRALEPGEQCVVSVAFAAPSPRGGYVRGYKFSTSAWLEIRDLNAEAPDEGIYLTGTVQIG